MLQGKAWHSKARGREWILRTEAKATARPRLGVPPLGLVRVFGPVVYHTRLSAPHLRATYYAPLDTLVRTPRLSFFAYRLS